MNKKQAQTICDTLIGQYPNVRSAEEDDLSCYCVGGVCIAFCNKLSPKELSKAAGSIRFPPPTDLVDILCELDKGLLRDDADVFVDNIIENNDMGYFDRAWLEFEKFLCNCDLDPKDYLLDYEETDETEASEETD